MTGTHAEHRQTKTSERCCAVEPGPPTRTPARWGGSSSWSKRFSPRNRQSDKVALGLVVKLDASVPSLMRMSDALPHRSCAPVDCRAIAVETEPRSPVYESVIAS